MILIAFLYFITSQQKSPIEHFDESKINTKQFAEDRLKEFNYPYYTPYLEKYFQKINFKDYKQIQLQNDGRIFCSVASYRDKQCPLTVHDMIMKAKDPSRLVICVCQQNDPSDVDCFDSYDSKGAVIKRIVLTDKDARGPCWARYLIQQEWTGEEYFLQIDSHMRFVQDWDQKCIDDLNKLPLKSCLTNYVGNFDLNTGETDKPRELRGPLRVDNKSTSELDGFFRINSGFISYAEGPILSYAWSACFSFSRSDIIIDAPYDPYTPYLFFGEEMDIWARMFTRGWYTYSPSVPICFTSFDRDYRPTFWENPDQAGGEFLSRLRLYYRFGYLNDIAPELKIDLDYFSLGNKKTWTDFLNFCLNEPYFNNNMVNDYTELHREQNIMNGY